VRLGFVTQSRLMCIFAVWVDRLIEKLISRGTVGGWWVSMRLGVGTLYVEKRAAVNRLIHLH
jgi:hypothetical protein